MHHCQFIPVQDLMDLLHAYAFIKLTLCEKILSPTLHFPPSTAVYTPFLKRGRVFYADTWVISDPYYFFSGISLQKIGTGCVYAHIYINFPPPSAGSSKPKT